VRALLRIGITAIVPILVASVVSVEPVAARSLSPEARAQQSLAQSLARLVKLPGAPPGVIALVQRGRQITVKTAGVAKVGGLPPTASDHMRLASTSKAFSGAVALALVSRGILSLNDTIGKLVPYLPRGWRAVTLRDALEHRSGLPNFTASSAYLSALQASPAHGPSPRGLLSFIAKQPLQFAPGSKYQYSNSDNIVVGLMVQAATGQSYRTELRRLVLGPLGLSQTSLPMKVAMPRPFIHGYSIEAGMAPQDISTVISPAWTWAAGGMVSTPADLNRFARAYIGGRLFSGAIRRQQLQTRKGDSEPPGPGVNFAGLAVFRYRTPCGTVYGHTGNFPGYTQFFASTLNGQRSVVVSTNEQLRPGVNTRVFDALRQADTLATCAALKGSG
jgi:D-alanyl-D-alanine carboxypeptidase